MRRFGMDIGNHRSQPLTEELVRRADLIFTMTGSHLGRVLELVPSAADRCHRLAGDHDIADPIGGSVDDYAACAGHIESALKRRLAGILE